jgi:hypothetical protein
MSAQISLCRSKANDELDRLGKQYHASLPIADIDAILVKYGFSATEPGIYTGRDGSCHECVGVNAWLRMSWHKMGSGRWEITAYVS